MRVNRWRRSLFGLITATLAINFLNGTNASAAEEGHRLMIVDAFSEGVSSGSEIYAVPEEQVQKIFKNEPNNVQSLRKFCESLTAPNCKEQTGLSLRIYLPKCTETLTNYCIDSLAISGASDAPLQPGTLLGYTDARTYRADLTRGVPESSTTSRWKVPGVKNQSGTDTYAVKVLLDGFLSATSNALYVFQVSALIEPYAEKTSSANTSQECTSWQSGTACGVRKDFIEGQKAQLSVRLPNTITGWLHGRLKGAGISVEKFDSTQNKVTVTAENVRVPELNTLFTDAQVDTLANPSFFRPNGRKWNSVNAGNPASLEWVKQLAKPLNETATGEHTTWSFSTIPSNRGNNKCFEDKTQLLGVVMTNSLVYSPNAPEFDGSQLNYQVGGLHFQPDGKTPNLGTYDLLIKSATARCLYNFTDAPLSASVSITYADGGEQKVATTTLSEKDGWLHLGAYGFTFSSPVLRVKLNGVPKALPQNSANSSAKSSPTVKQSTKSYTMTCVKGKVVKKVIAPKPTCPSGWKKR